MIIVAVLFSIVLIIWMITCSLLTAKRNNTAMIIDDDSSDGATLGPDGEGEATKMTGGIRV